MLRSAKRIARILLLMTLLLTGVVIIASCQSGTSATSADTTTATTTSTANTTNTPTSSTTAVTSTAPDSTSAEAPDTDIALPAINDQNGLMWYQFEEGDGALVLKSSLSQPRDSILFEGALTEAGGVDGGGFAIFSGSGDGIKLNNTFTDWGQIQDGTFLHPATQKLSVAFFIMPDSLDGLQMLLEYGSQYRGFAIGLDNELLTCSVTAASASDADGVRIALDPVALPESACTEWTHIFFTYDGTLDGGTVTLYVNFKKAASASGVGAYLPKVLDASGIATTKHGTNSLMWNDADYGGKMDDLRIYKDSFTQLPALEENAIYLQSAAQKNHYLKATELTLSCDAMVEPALRGIIIENGLADGKGVSLRMSGTENYLMAEGGSLTAGKVKSDEDKQAATFYAESPLAVPSWGEADRALFTSFSTKDGKYITAKGSSVSLTAPVSESEKLSATFKKTADQTEVIEGLRGVVYYPSYALNAPQFWKWYDSEIIERDMQYAKKLNFDALRIWVSYEYWLEDPAHFEASYNDFLSLAEQYDLKIMVSLFEGCGKDTEGYNSANVWSRDYTLAWSITSPAKEIYENPARWDEPKAFVTWFFEHYKNDDRHMAIEIYNEPWGSREACAKYLSEYAVSIQGSVPITFGTAPAGSYNIVYSVDAGADMIHYHDNFPTSTDAFYQNALTRIEQGRLANLPVYCTEVQWVGGPANINYPVYRNLAPTVESLMETDVWAPFYWTLMVHPCYLDSYRNNYKMKNGIVQEDGSYFSIENAQAIAPEADLSHAEENNHNPFDDQSYRYRDLFSDGFADKHAYKWTAITGTWSAASGDYVGSGLTLANATDFADFQATFTVDPNREAGFVFRAKDENNFYYAAVSVGKLTLYRVKDGVKTLLSENRMEYTGGSITVTVSAKGNTLRASANCTDCTATDSAFSSGMIGFSAEEASAFASVSVSKLAD